MLFDFRQKSSFVKREISCFDLFSSKDFSAKRHEKKENPRELFLGKRMRKHRLCSGPNTLCIWSKWKKQVNIFQQQNTTFPNTFPKIPSTSPATSRIISETSPRTSLTRGHSLGKCSKTTFSCISSGLGK